MQLNLYHKIRKEEDRNQLQLDLDYLSSTWSAEWMMEYNATKCKRMHIGYGNPKCEYEMKVKDTGGFTSVKLKEESEEKDLGILVDNELKFSRHIQSIIAETNKILGLIKRSFEELDKEMFLLLYKGLVRSKLEYCVQAWSPYLKKDIISLEGVQRRATKMIPGFENKSYEERLKELNLTTLMQRRKRGDMIELYRMLHGLEKIDSTKFVTISQGERTRGSSLKLYKKRCRLDVRKYFFSQKCECMEQFA